MRGKGKRRRNAPDENTMPGIICPGYSLSETWTIGCKETPKRQKPKAGRSLVWRNRAAQPHITSCSYNLSALLRCRAALPRQTSIDGIIPIAALGKPRPCFAAVITTILLNIVPLLHSIAVALAFGNQASTFFLYISPPPPHARRFDIRHLQSVATLPRTSKSSKFCNTHNP